MIVLMTNPAMAIDAVKPAGMKLPDLYHLYDIKPPNMMSTPAKKAHILLLLRGIFDNSQ